MADYIADTHALLWYFTRPQRLGPKAREAFSQVGDGSANLLVPVIVLAEIIFVLEGGRVQADLDVVLRTLQALPNVFITDLDLQCTLALRTLKAVPEMHDRMIVATAIARDAILITRDPAIRSSGLVPTIW